MTASPYDENALRRWLIDYLITNIGCDPDDIDLDLSFNELGVGSRDGVVLSGELAEFLGRPVSPVDLWQHPTTNALVHFLSSSEPGPEQTFSGTGSVDGPIAVVGIGCRFPGDISSPEDLWEFLCGGRCSIEEVPADRWLPFDDGSPGVAAALARTTRWGSYLSDIKSFDAAFFEISPTEADNMDPQQRMVLEVAWEALEHAGIPPTSLRRSQTGVFVGACGADYGYLASRDLGQISAWTNTGGALSIIANRLSYFLDLRGPSLMVDTACSSSLVAVHLACQSLRVGDCDLAITAGVNLLLSPAVFRGFDEAEALSANGQCHAFDASADGFVRGEGCGVVVLKRLADAVRDGDRVLAIVRGSAVNQDGRSNGLMAPNPSAQMAAIRAACTNAGVEPRDVDYVETHGTGTLLGDPIEARALGTVLGRGRAETSPLLIGAIKSNLGHLEAAAGVAGFIKAVLAVQHGHIPPNLDFEAPNPHIPFKDARLKVVAEGTDWPPTGRPRRAGVSSFGFGGTNAHVVLEQGPDPDPVAAKGSPAVTTLVVSGKTPQRVASWASVLADWMEGTGAAVPLADVAHTLNHHRALHAKFATVCALDRAQAVGGLRSLARGEGAVGVVDVHAGPCGAGRVFVYSGQGSQWAGMARRLLADEPAFAATVAELEPVFIAQTGFSLQQVLTDDEPIVGIARIQPVLVAIQLALTALWRSHGIEPDAVIGHSMGEVSAAVVAGALSTADGLRVIATRSSVMSRLSGRGAMALLELDADATEALIADYPQVTLAVYASPRQSVISGPSEAIEKVIAAVQASDKLARRIDVDVASHNSIIDPVLPELRTALADLAPRTPVIPLITTTYDPGTDTPPVFDADYWAANLRNPVRFTHAIAAAAQSHAMFIEVSPHPLLTHAISDTLATVHHHSIGTLQRDTHDTLTFHTNLNSAHTVHPPHTGHPPEPHLQLPTTPWHRTKHWIAITEKATTSGSAPRAGTLLGDRITVSSAPTVHMWQARLAPDAKPYPGCHRVRGVEVVPVSVLLQSLLTATAEIGTAALSAIQFHHPIVVDQPRVIQVVADHESIRLASSLKPEAPADRWVIHVTAQLAPAAIAPAQSPDPPAAIAPAQSPDPLALRELNGRNGADGTVVVAELLRSSGIEGTPFAWTIESSTSTPTSIYAEVGLAEPSTVALLDAAVHVAPLVGCSDSRLFVPASVEHAQFDHAFTDSQGLVSVHKTFGDNDEMIVDISATTSDGRTCISIRSMRYVALEPESTQSPQQNADARMFAHSIEWRPVQDRRNGQTRPAGLDTIAVTGVEENANQQFRNRFEHLGYTSVGVDAARYVLYVASPHSTDCAAADIDCAVGISADVVALVRRLATRDAHHPVTLWIITRGVHEAADASALRQSCLWGLAGVVSVEHPELWGGLVDIPADSEICDCLSALSGVLPKASKSILLLRNGQFLAQTWVPVAGEARRETLRCQPDAAYLITGAMGSLGLLMADWLADRGARRLILAGRTPLPPRRDWDVDSIDTRLRERIAAIRALEMRGVAVDVVALDVGSGEGVQALLRRRDRDGAPPIRGVIHAAGVTHDQLLTEMADGPLRGVMWPKISGGQALHEAFPPGSLDFFYLTASAGAVYGIPGQGSYAAANAYLDALARARHRQGCHTLSLDWVAWRGLGFAAEARTVTEELERLGTRPLTPEEAFAAWEYVDTYDVAQAIVFPIPASADERGSTNSDASRTRDWTQMPAGELVSALENELRAILAMELRMPVNELDLDRPFAELGINSLMAMGVRRKAEQLLDIELSATMLWNHPTVSSLAAYLAKELSPRQEPKQDRVLGRSDSTGSILDTLFESIESISAGTETRTK
jgi:phthiocerol/phenolphthiocerol synthesis type-I polyketide synthase A